MTLRLATRAAALALLLTRPPVASAQSLAPVPWETGEYLEYTVKFGIITAGSGRMQVLGLDTLRGRTVWRLHFNVSGGTFFYRVNDSYDSWLDAQTLNSLRFVQELSEGNRDRKRVYDMFPDRAMYLEQGKEEKKSVPDPLDDASFFFFVRTVPLEVGKTYEFDRYFNPDANPVIVRVLRRERVEVPAGTFDAIVIQPVIKTPGIFGSGGRAELWLSDDKRRILVQMKSKLPFGSLNLYLTSTNFELKPSAPKDTSARPAHPRIRR